MTACSVHRTDIKIEPDVSRVLIRPFIPKPSRIVKILARIAAQTDEEVEEHLQKILTDFSNRHIEVEQTFLERYDQVKTHQFTDLEPSLSRKLLIGSYFTSEYSLESAALFNPSIVPHPDQTSLPYGSMRFIISLRAVGEGHISSVAFRTGTIDQNNLVTIEPPTNVVTTPDPIINQVFLKDIFSQKLLDLDVTSAYATAVLNLLPNEFIYAQLMTAIQEIHYQQPGLSAENKTTRDNLILLAQANYNVRFDPSVPLGGRVLFPFSPTEKNGIEDARFVAFRNSKKETIYYGTATAWDGKKALSQLIETKDFQTFSVRTLNGEVVKNKGMALFPRKINGKYAMISRQDNENIYIMFSEHLQFWRESQLLVRPTRPWEYYQMGNCGSPIETDDGWILFTHGVGAMRRYAIGAVLLDKEDPTKVIARTRCPILAPNENEREGYVPNVVYSCGAMIHGNTIVLPYAMADQASRMALINVNELLECMKENGLNHD